MQNGDHVVTDQRRRADVLAGDELAWREWYDATFDDLRAYAHWRCGFGHLVDDVVQETWLTAVRRIRAFDPRRGSFRRWLFGIAANIVRNHLRAAAASRRREAALAGDESQADAADSATVARAARVARALAALATRQEEVLRAKYFERMSVQAIAAAWGDTPKAVESLLTRARQAFREVYDAEAGDG